MSDQEKPNEYFTKIINEQNEKINQMAKEIKGLQTTQNLEPPQTKTETPQSSTPETTLSEAFRNIYKQMKEAK